MSIEPPAYDEVAERYHRVFDPDGSRLRDPIFEDLLGDVAGEEVLALACGQGRDARLLADLGATVVGVDVSEQMLSYARRFEQTTPLGIRYVRGDAQELEAFGAESFDGVACHMALMDIPELEPAITSVARVLRPGGWFVFSIVHPGFGPHVDAVSGYLVEALYEKPSRPEMLPLHAYHRPLSSYVNTLARAGLSVTRLVETPHDEAAYDGGVPGLLYARCAKTGG